LGGPARDLRDVGQGSRYMGQTRVANDGLHQALARAGDGAFAVGPEGRVALWNRSAEKILGWSAREVLGRPCGEVLVGVDARKNGVCDGGCDVAGQFRLGQPVVRFQMEARTKAGRPIWLDLSVLEAPVTNGGRPLAIHLFRDITDTKRLLEMVQERLRPNGQTNGNGAMRLTRREVEILRLMALGANTKALAEQLHVSPATVRNHAQNIFSKLEVHSRLEAVAWANRHRLV